MRERIAAALLDAEETNDRMRLTTLRLIQVAIDDRDEAAEAQVSPETSGDAALAGRAQTSELIELLAKMIRQREESAQGYEEAGRLELADRERAEIAVIREFLPSPLSAEEERSAVAETIARLGADDIRDIGRVMQSLKAAYPGRLDVPRACAAVRTALS